MQLEYLADLPVMTIIELARRLDLHPADLIRELDSVLDNPRDLEPHMPRQQTGELTDDARALLVEAALVQAGVEAVDELGELGVVGNAEGLTPARLRTPPCRLINQLATTASRVIGQALSGTGSRPYHYALLGRGAPASIAATSWRRSTTWPSGSWSTAPRTRTTGGATSSR
ncbi:hypothetical protein [Nonomuraea sp. NPDC050310]|uniref:hypothetical protein n=1 Tax=Nonomuraea sp. NPDC050310 TaxID=3154935 RepID=UPI0033C13C5B